MTAPMVNSPSRLFNLATLRNARITRRIVRPLFLSWRASFSHLALRLLWFLPCSQRVGCSTPDPLHLPPPRPVRCLLTWNFLTFLLSVLPSPRFPRQSFIVAAGLNGRGEPNPRLFACNPRQRDHVRAPRIRQYTDEVSVPHIPGTGTRHDVPGTGTLLWSDRQGQGGGRHLIVWGKTV